MISGKAYDTVPWGNLSKFMADMEINGTIPKIFEEYVEIGNELSDPIKVTKGLGQS